MTSIENLLNPIEVMQVEIDLEKRKIKNYKLVPGNDCIWVQAGSSSIPLNLYYIFRNGAIADVQID
jgi:hypothetical protein